MKIIKVLFLLFLISNVAAQSVTLTHRSNNNLPYNEDGVFDYLAPDADITKLLHVATYKAVAGTQSSSVAGSYLKIAKQAMKLGANCFLLTGIEIDESNNSIIFELDLFYANEAILEYNSTRFRKNKVFIFGNENINEGETSLKVNGTTQVIQPGTYLTYVLEEGQELKLSKGGLTGASYKLKYKENREPNFFTLSDFGLDSGAPTPGTIGLSFNTGRINSIDSGLGYLLSRILVGEKK